MENIHVIRWLLVLAGVLEIHAECCKNAVAVLQDLSGSATAQYSGSPHRIDVHRFDWLSEGTTLELGEGSKAILILVNGHRYELGSRAQATVFAARPPKISGVARELVALPPIPTPAPIATTAASTSGASRIRGMKMSQLYPYAGTFAIASKVTLRFAVVPGATSYRVAIEDVNGNRLFNMSTEATAVVVTDSILKPGEHYLWLVRAMSSGGVEIGSGTETFNTLTARDLMQRLEFAKALGAQSDDPSMYALLADVDLRLGLIAEACDEFNMALESRPDDTVLRRALESARTSLTDQNH
jgi:hypothetical protein